MFENITIKEIFLQEREDKYGDRKEIESLIQKAEDVLTQTYKEELIEIKQHISLPDDIFCVAATLRSDTDFLEATVKMDNIIADYPELTGSCVYPYFIFEDFDGDVMYYLKTEIEALKEDDEE